MSGLARHNTALGSPGMGKSLFGRILGGLVRALAAGIGGAIGGPIGAGVALSAFAYLNAKHGWNLRPTNTTTGEPMTNDEIAVKKWQNEIFAPWMTNLSLNITGSADATVLKSEAYRKKINKVLVALTAVKTYYENPANLGGKGIFQDTFTQIQASAADAGSKSEIVGMYIKGISDAYAEELVKAGGQTDYGILQMSASEFTGALPSDIQSLGNFSLSVPVFVAKGTGSPVPQDGIYNTSLPPANGNVLVSANTKQTANANTQTTETKDNKIFGIPKIVAIPAVIAGGIFLLTRK